MKEYIIGIDAGGNHIATGGGVGGVFSYFAADAVAYGGAGIELVAYGLEGRQSRAYTHGGDGLDGAEGIAHLQHLARQDTP